MTTGVDERTNWMLSEGPDHVRPIHMGSVLLDLSGMTGEEANTLGGGPIVGGSHPWDMFQVSLSKDGVLHVDGTCPCTPPRDETAGSAPDERLAVTQPDTACDQQVEMVPCTPLAQAYLCPMQAG